MAGSKARTHAVAFRLSPEEYNHVKAACSVRGVRSVADFVRSSVLRAAVEPSLGQVEKKLDELRSAVREITQTLVKS